MDITTEEAVKFLKNIVKQNGDLDSSTSIPFYKKEAKAIEKVLNELDTLQNGFNTAGEHQTELIRENSHLRYELFNNQKELEEKDKIIKNQSYTNKKMRKKLDGYRKLLKLKERHLSKKDKIIDAMTEEIEKFGCISTEVFDSTKECMDMQNCIDCIKQYFERRVKDE